MKVLRFLLILILILIVAVLVLGLVEPKEITISRSATINAPRAVVWEQISKFKNWNNWSPWYQMEPNDIKITYFGNDGEAGSGYHWVGKKTGEGEMTDKGISDGHMDFQLHFIKPMSGMADGSFDAKDSAGMTHVTWTMTNHMKYPWNALCVFINMDKMVGKDFEKGLARMKSYAESHAGNANAMPAAANVNIQEVQFPGHMYAGIRSTIRQSDVMKVFHENAAKLSQAAGSRISGPMAGLYYTWDTTTHTSDMAVAFPVSGTDPVKGATMINVPASKAYMVASTGNYNNLMNAHMAINQRMTSKNEKWSVAIEEYVKGPNDEKDTSKWMTNVYYILK